MTVATALFFDASQRRLGLPGLEPHLRTRAQDLVPSEYHNIVERPSFDSILTGERFTRARLNGFIGVPLLNDRERLELINEYEVHEFADELLQGTWWELWRTSNGDYALLPGDSEEALTLTVTALVRSGSVVQLRRFISGVVLNSGGLKQTPPTIPADSCVREDVDEPGAPYHGRCVDKGCGAGCSADVVLVPDLGLYLLKGCSCP